MAGSYGKQNNSPRGKHGPSGNKSPSPSGKSTGLRKSDEMRSDVTATPSSKKPYPQGLA